MKTQTISIKRLLSYACLLLISVIPISHAQNIAPSPCDPNYYDSMEARAWLEAQREISQNQNLIFKPDSVLEYSCFDQFIGILASTAPNMFSQSSRWGSPPGNISSSLNNVVGSAYSSYKAGNFAHGYLGGRKGDFAPAGQTSPYTCNIMNQVWESAKCMNFFDQPDQDGFFTFAEYADPARRDVRRLPPMPGDNPACAGPGNGPAGWQGQINKAVVNATLPWLPDNVNTFFNDLNQTACGSSLKIKTGITIRRESAPTEFYEHICLAPGCYYVPSNQESGTCVKVN